MGLNKLLKMGRKSNIVLRKLINWTTRRLYSCDIPCDTNIADTAFFAHEGLGCVVNRECVIEDNVFIQHRVTIGVKRSGEGAPVIKKNVAIGPGAIIIGNITVGENSVVAAGAIVVKDVPPNTIVGGGAQLVLLKTLKGNQYCSRLVSEV